MRNKIIIIVIFFAVIIITVVVLLYSGIVPTAQEQNTQSNSAVSAPDKLIQQQAQMQIQNLQERLTADPQNSDTKRELGRAYFLAGDLKKAEQFIQEVMSVDPKNPQYYVDMGNIYLAKKDIAKAEELYKKAITLNDKEIFKDPTPAQMSLEIETNAPAQLPPVVYKLPTPYSALAGLYLNNLNKPEQAIEILREGIRVLPKYPDFYLMLSDAYQKTGDSANAAKYKEQFNTLIF